MDEAIKRLTTNRMVREALAEMVVLVAGYRKDLIEQGCPEDEALYLTNEFQKQLWAGVFNATGNRPGDV